jgi:uncharacterized protein YqiB (DUF1249 family)
MIADQWCATSWRARPGSFVSLMTLYESNFVRLGWLVSNLRSLPGHSLSRTPYDCDLHLSVLERSRYTSVLRLTYEFRQDGQIVQDPNLEVCVYHDARLAEVRGFLGFVRHSHMARLQMQVKRELDQRWSHNMMLNKWLEYCAERGHRF